VKVPTSLFIGVSSSHASVDQAPAIDDTSLNRLVERRSYAQAYSP
jgi:hypothetical protein